MRFKRVQAQSKKINTSYVNYSSKTVSVNGCPSKKLYGIFDRSTIIKSKFEVKEKKPWSLLSIQAILQNLKPLH